MSAMVGLVDDSEAAVFALSRRVSFFSVLRREDTWDLREIGLGDEEDMEMKWALEVGVSRRG